MSEPTPIRPPRPGSVRLEVGRGPLAAPVLTRSLAMLAGLTSLPAERLRDVPPIVDALLASHPSGRVVVEARAARDGRGLRVLVRLPRGQADDVGRRVGMAGPGAGVAVRRRPGGDTLLVTLPPSVGTTEDEQ